MCQVATRRLWLWLWRTARSNERSVGWSGIPYKSTSTTTPRHHRCDSGVNGTTRRCERCCCCCCCCSASCGICGCGTLVLICYRAALSIVRPNQTRPSVPFCIFRCFDFVVVGVDVAVASSTLSSSAHFTSLYKQSSSSSICAHLHTCTNKQSCDKTTTTTTTTTRVEHTHTHTCASAL